MKVRGELIEKWIDDNRPHGLEKLVLASDLSRSLLEKARAGRLPKRRRTIVRLCRALGLTEDELIVKNSAS